LGEARKGVRSIGILIMEQVKTRGPRGGVSIKSYLLWFKKNTKKGSKGKRLWTGGANWQPKNNFDKQI